jgi:uncharacterized RDD family membrane protein YckC
MDSNVSIDVSNCHTPGFLRRCAAILYDTLVLCGVLIVAAALVVVPLGGIYGIEIGSGNLLFQVYLCAVIFVFFAWFWVHGGQTPGMRAWQVRLIRDEGTEVRWRDAMIRFLGAIAAWAPCGLGFIWLLVDTNKLTWYDRLSRTRLVMLKLNTPCASSKGPPPSG